MLVAIGVLAYAWVSYNAPVLKRGRQAQTEVAGIGLKTVEGERYQVIGRRVNGSVAGRSTASRS